MIARILLLVCILIVGIANQTFAAPWTPPVGSGCEG
jgi:hypothetical protein